MGNESQCGQTNRTRTAICLSALRLRSSRAICLSALGFISHEPRKKDRSSRDLFVPHCDSFPMNRKKRHSFLIFTMPPTKTPSKFSEQSKKIKFPAEIGHLTLFQDKTILAYSFRQTSAGSCRRFCRLFIDKLIKTKAWLVYHYIY